MDKIMKNIDEGIKAGKEKAAAQSKLSAGVRRCVECKDLDSQEIMSFVLRCRNCRHWNHETIELLSGLIGKKKYINAYCTAPNGKFKGRLMDDWKFCDDIEISA